MSTYTKTAAVWLYTYRNAK